MTPVLPFFLLYPLLSEYSAQWGGHVEKSRADLHVNQPRTGWDAARVVGTLRADLKRMQETQGLRPDPIFFTGDAAYGHISNERGKAIALLS
ncbi:hypothetical protein [Synechococcus sp. PCC 7336]|uniref:hypothetical protein n=1 Tax=Synechococcus sp. PCC 7336 TaxID=195250 RepID=UPI001D0CEE70|nr:hypothetical protein [Synechococcus sp. PCC 7336]